MASVLDTLGSVAFDLGYRCSPIIFTGGIASAVPGGLLPIIAITEAANFLTGLLAGASVGTDSFFAHYEPLPGTDLANYQIGQYPFANQSIAANAIIRMPLRVRLLMHTHVRHAGGYSAKLLTFTALRQAIDLHASKGGTYTVAMPAQLQTNLVLLSLRDVGGEGLQKQTTWEWEFEQPLLTLADAASAQNANMYAISNGSQTTGSTSGLAQSTGSTGALSGASTVPSAGGTAGGNVGGFTSAASTPAPVGTPLAAPAAPVATTSYNPGAVPRGDG